MTLVAVKVELYESTMKYLRLQVNAWCVSIETFPGAISSAAFLLTVRRDSTPRTVVRRWSLFVALDDRAESTENHAENRSDATRRLKVQVESGMGILGKWVGSDPFTRLSILPGDLVKRLLARRWAF